MIPKAWGWAGIAKDRLEQRQLGKTGIRVTTLGFGASRTQEPAVLKAALDRGITFIDTGRAYANGQNEEMIGQVLKDTRQQYVIQSKMKVDPEKLGAKPQRIRREMETSLEASLKALQTDYVDVMLLHGITRTDVLQNETIQKVLEEMKAKGAIRAHGFSAHTNHVELLTQANQQPFYDVAMIPFNPSGGFKHSLSGWTTSWDQQALIRQMQQAHENGMGLVAMKTCSGGTYAPNNRNSSYPGAVQWVCSHPFVHTTAVAMANFNEIKAHTS